MIRIVAHSLHALLRPAVPRFAFCVEAKKPESKVQSITASFTDRASEQTKERPITNGRSWKAGELRLKSTEDLHKLWYVCVREKNLVLADELALEHDPTHARKAGKIRRVEKLQQTMSRILHVIAERERIRKHYRAQLEQDYVDRKRAELADAVASQPEPLPEITREMLRSKYEALRKGRDNVEYLERIWQREEEVRARTARSEQRSLRLDPAREFSSFWEQEMRIGERPTQNEILKAHITNWKSLNLKQRKIILGFLNARRAVDAKSTFVKELRLLGQQIAQEEARSRAEGSRAQGPA